MKRLLVTGATGTLGRALLCAAAGEHTWQVVPATHTQTLPDGLRLELSQPASIRKALDEARPDAVIHTAAVTDTGHAEGHPEEAMRVNRDGTLTLARECHSRGLRLLALSTDLVFPGREGGLYREEDEVFPISHYGRSKAEAERMALAAMPEILIVRTTLLLANGKRGHVAWIKRDLALGGASYHVD